MTDKGRKQRVLRWTVVSAGLVALFWTVWYLVTGSVPEVTSAPIGLPIAVSRWWDVAYVAVYSMLSALCWPRIRNLFKVTENEDGLMRFLSGANLLFGLLFVAVSDGLAVGLIAVFLVTLVFSLLGLMSVEKSKIWAMAWSMGLLAVIPRGLIDGLAILAVSLLSVGCVHLICATAPPAFRVVKATLRWLMAEAVDSDPDSENRLRLDAARVRVRELEEQRDKAMTELVEIEAEYASQHVNPFRTTPL